MKRALPLGLALVLALLALSASWGGVKGDKKDPLPTLPPSAKVKVSDLEDFALKSDGMVFNNLIITEQPPYDRADSASLRLRGCYCNRVPRHRAFTLVVVGLDRDGDLLWATSLRGAAAPSDVSFLPETQVPVPPGTWEKTASLQLRAHVSDARPRYYDKDKKEYDYKYKKDK
jgi:hypothetical protein